VLPLIVALLNLAPSILPAFRKAGVAVAPIPGGSNATIDEVEQIVGMAGADYANFESGQAVVLGTFTEGGKPSTIVAFQNGGAAATALGL
jgi:hypothetical protein